jgi:hypothetical protein
MFENKNNINFGKINEQYIGGVELPPWAKNNYHFILVMRTFLESEFVSYKLNEWIDLIFGYKQKGKDAEAAMNLFWKFTYEDEIDIDLIQKKNIDEYNSYVSKVEFGQTPSQIFKTPTTRRINKEIPKSNKTFIENKKNLKVYKSTSESKNQYKNKKDIINKMIIKIKSLDRDRLICVYNNGIVQIMKLYDTPYSLSRFTFIKEKESFIHFEYVNKENYNTFNVYKPYSNNENSSSRIIDEDETIMKDININQPIKIIRNGKFIIKGGYHDGKFLLFNMEIEESFYT